MGKFGADTALEYVMQGSFVKGMERKCQEAAQKLHCLIHGSVCRLISTGDFRGANHKQLRSESCVPVNQQFRHKCLRLRQKKGSIWKEAAKNTDDLKSSLLNLI